MSGEKEKKELLKLLGKARGKYPFKNIYFAEKTPLFCHKPVEYLPWHRFTMILGGRTQLGVAMNGKRTKLWLEEGDIMIFAPFCWCQRMWEKDEDHKNISIVFERNYLRVVYKDFSKKEATYAPPTWYYHIEDSLSLATINVIKALTSVNINCPSEKLIRELINIALELVTNDLEKSQWREHGKSYVSWLKLVHYIENNYNEKLTRKSLGKQFGLSQVYISKLFQKYSICTMNTFLKQVRLENAAKLLVETNMNVEEIAWQCGYKCTSFFIRKFREMYSFTPTVFRQVNISKDNLQALR